VSCYLCAYNQPQLPSKSLPAGSPAGQNDDLGTCSVCSVWACSMHGTRPSLFECAICTPATAAKQAVVAGSAGNAAAAVAHLVGSQATTVLRDRVGAALELVVANGRQQVDGQGDNRSVVAPGTGQVNLVTNLADVIRGPAGGPRAFVPAVRVTNREGGSMVDEAALDEAVPIGEVPAGAISIDVLGGAVREAFTGRELIYPTPDAVTIATGSLLLAYSLADETIAARRSEHPAYWPRLEDALPAPWEVSHPVLLDAVIWMVGTAYVLSPGVSGARQS
jgi:hypothetical protein